MRQGHEGTLQTSGLCSRDHTRFWDRRDEAGTVLHLRKGWANRQAGGGKGSQTLRRAFPPRQLLPLLTTFPALPLPQTSCRIWSGRAPSVATAVVGRRPEPWTQPATGVQCLGYAPVLEKHSGLLAIVVSIWREGPHQRQSWMARRSNAACVFQRK